MQVADLSTNKLATSPPAQPRAGRMRQVTPSDDTVSKVELVHHYNVPASEQ